MNPVLSQKNVILTTAFCVLAIASVRAQQTASVAPAVTPAVTSTSVTTPGGTAGLLPLWTGTSTIGNSILYQNSSGIGIGRSPSSMLDVNGTSTFRGVMGISRAGDATTSVGSASFPFRMQSSVYSTSAGKNVLPYFQLMTEPAGNNTASPGATLNFLYNNGVAASVSETGLYINSNGTIHFASAQTFPSTANGITSVSHDASLAGAGTSASPLGVAAVGHDANFSGKGTSASPLALATTLNVGAVNSSQTVYANLPSTNTTVFTPAVQGIDNSGIGEGVRGLSYANGSNNSGYGGVFQGSVGVYSQGSQYAGTFYGNVYVSGTLSKAGGSFKIDHPLDPGNKFLSHSFVESPDMMNIYNGNVTTDARGEAVVTMPDYFESLNRDFRYQLTVIGQFAQAIVGSELTGNTFVIRTDKPSVKVSWQVTGIRQDAWANANRIPNEEDKPTAQRGHYLHPELFGHAGEAAITEHAPTQAPIR